MSNYLDEGMNFYPYYDDTITSAIPKDYVRLLAIPGRVLQAREVTSLQTLIQNQIKNLAGTLMRDGDILEGLQPSIIIEGGRYVCKIAPGKVYAKGFIWTLPDTTVLDISDPGGSPLPSVTVDLVLQETITTEAQDPSLRDPALGYKNYNQPGTHRLKVAPKLEINTTDGIKLFYIENGELLTLPTSDFASKITDILARRTYDESSNYLVDGLSFKNLKENWESWKGNYADYLLYETATAVIETTGYLRINATVQGNYIGKYVWVYSAAGFDSMLGIFRTIKIQDRLRIVLADLDSDTPKTFGNVVPITVGVRIMETPDTLTLGISRGKCYVQGYEIVHPSKTFLDIDRAATYRETFNELKTIEPYDPGGPGEVTDYAVVNQPGRSINWDEGGDGVTVPILFAKRFSYNLGDPQSYLNPTYPGDHPGVSYFRGLYITADHIQWDIKNTGINPYLFTLNGNVPTPANVLIDNSNNDKFIISGNYIVWAGGGAPALPGNYLLIGIGLVNLDIRACDFSQDTYPVGYMKKLADGTAYLSLDQYIRECATYSYTGNPGTGWGMQVSTPDRDASYGPIMHRDYPRLTSTPLNEDAQMDYTWYIARHDLVYIDKLGRFGILAGDPDLPDNVEVRPGLLGTLDLCSVYLPPNSNDISLTEYQIFRITMPELNKLRSRIDELEYNQARINLIDKGKDGELPTDLSGILTDNFTGFQVADTNFIMGSIDYDCAIDPEDELLTLPHREVTYDMAQTPGDLYINGVGIDAVNTTDIDTNYTYLLLANDGEQTLINQPYATSPLNINPYAVFAFDPRMSLSPDVDNWIVTQNAEIIEVNQRPIFQRIPLRKHRFLRRFWLRKPVDSVNAVDENNEQLKQWRTAEVPSSELWRVRKDKFARRVDLARPARAIFRQVLRESTTTVRNREVLVMGDNFPAGVENVIPKFDGKVVGMYYIDEWNGTAWVPVANPGTPAVPVLVMETYTGRWRARFRIPENIAAGEKLFTVDNIDDPTPGKIDVYSEAMYKANVNVVRDTEVIIRRQPVRRVTGSPIAFQHGPLRTVTAGKDPLAETFAIEEDAMLKKVKVYFAPYVGGTLPPTEPVICQIRNVTNGYPGPEVFEEVIKYAADITVSANASVATTFEFANPVFVKANTEYCLVFMTASNRYQMWIGELGGTDITTGTPVSQQPYNVGVLFTSSNNTAWTANQAADLKFEMVGFKFKTTGTLTFNEINLATKDPSTFSILSWLADTITPEGTSLVFQVKLGGSTSWVTIDPYEIYDYSSAFAKVVARVVFTSTNDKVSPFINKDGLTMSLRKYEQRGYYITKSIEPPQYNNVKQVVEANIDILNTNITTYFGFEDNIGNVFWVPSALASTEVLPEGGGWKKLTYETELKLPVFNQNRGGWIQSNNFDTLAIDEGSSLTLDFYFNTRINLDGSPEAGSPTVSLTLNGKVGGAPYTRAEVFNLMQAQFTLAGLSYVIALNGDFSFTIQNTLTGGSWVEPGNPNFLSPNILVEETATGPGTVGRVFDTGKAMSRCGYATAETIAGGALTAGEWYGVLITKTNGAGETMVADEAFAYLVRTDDLAVNRTIRVRADGNIFSGETPFETGGTSGATAWNVYVADLGNDPDPPTWWTDVVDYLEVTAQFKLQGTTALSSPPAPAELTMDITAFNAGGAPLPATHTATYLADNFRARIDLTKGLTTEDAPQVRSLINVMKDV